MCLPHSFLPTTFLPATALRITGRMLHALSSPPWSLRLTDWLCMKKVFECSPKILWSTGVRNFISVDFLSFTICRQHSLTVCIDTQYLLFHFSYLLWNVQSWTWWSPINSLKAWAWTPLRKAWALHWTWFLTGALASLWAWAPHSKGWALTGRPELFTGSGLLSGPRLLTVRCGLH